MNSPGLDLRQCALFRNLMHEGDELYLVLIQGQSRNNLF